MAINRKILVCTALFSFLFTHTAENVPVVLQDPLCISMQATGAELNKVYLTGRVRIDEAASAEMLRQIVQQTAAEFGGADSGAPIQMRWSNYQSSAHLAFDDRTQKVNITARQIVGDAAAPPGGELIIQIIKELPEEADLVNLRQKISGILQEFEAVPVISTCLEGYVDGKLRKEEWAFCLRDAFDSIGAKVATKTCNDAYVSYTGFSPLLPDKVKAGANVLNLNVAMRYHEFDQRTYVIIGSPVIAIEY